MSKKFIVIKNSPRQWKAENDKPKPKRQSKTKAISALKEARKFIAYFNGSTEQIDIAIEYLKQQ